MCNWRNQKKKNFRLKNSKQNTSSSNKISASSEGVSEKNMKIYSKRENPERPVYTELVNRIMLQQY